MLKWDEVELTEFFGVAATFSEEAYSHSFEICRDGLRLLATIFDLENAVYASIFRDALAEPLFTVRRDSCRHVHITKTASFRRCFETGTTEFPVTDMGIQPTLTRGFRVYIEPQFEVELIEPQNGVT